MEKFAILAILKSQPGKEKTVFDFLKSALPLAIGEPGTVRWYAAQIDASTFCIFDTFITEDGRQAHLDGPIAAALMANVSNLLADEPAIKMAEIIALK